MSGVNRLLFLIFSILSVIILVEAGYLVYLNYFFHGYTSLSSVSKRKDYDSWLAKNSAVTSSRLVSPGNNIQMIVNHTEGILKSYTVENNNIKILIQTPKGPVNYSFSPKGFKTYLKPANTEEVLLPINAGDIKNGDKVVIHESYNVVGNNIVNTDNGIVKLE